MILEKNLALQELTLSPGKEWTQRHSGWVVLRAVSGEGYLLKRGATRSFGAGDLLLLHHEWPATLRASALGSLRLQFFYVQPQLLGGLLTLREAQRFQEVARMELREAIIFPASEGLAQKFAQVTSRPNPDLPGERCRRLQLWLEAMAQLSPYLLTAPSDAESLPLRERFCRLLGQISAEDLSGGSFGELAGQLGCSRRHFHRLFREEFGVPPRTYLTRLRMARARQFLTESDAKIINVAQQSGYNHLGLFNQTFKQQFGMTPGNWRRLAKKQTDKVAKPSLHRKLLSLVLTALFLCGTLAAQTNQPTAAKAAPSAAAPSVSSTNPAPPLKFEIRDYVVEGNTRLDQRVIDSILAPAKGREITFQQVNQAIVALQKEYHDRGLVTVLVTLPQQKLTNATIKIKVVESPLAAINVVGNRYYSSNNIMAKLPSLRTNALLNSFVLQRELDAANASRDRQIYTVLGPGPEPETSALTLRVKDQLPLHGRLELDNYNTPGSPDLRANFNAQYDNLWDLDHQVGIQYSFTPESLKSQTGDERVPFDAPLIANYSAYYRMPIGSQKAVQDELDANPSQFGYVEASHQFQAPPVFSVPQLTFYASRATTDSGIQYGPLSPVVTNNPLLNINSQTTGENTTLNNNLGSRFSLPLDTGSKIKLTANCGIDFKEFRMASYNTNNFLETLTFTNQNGPYTTNFLVSSGQPERRSSVTYLPLNAGFDLEATDPLGTSFINLSANFNVLPVFSGDADFADTAYSSNARASYFAGKVTYNRDQKIYGDWRLFLRAGGQWSPNPLISNEQFPLGGMSSVRGYHEGEVYGDSGWNVSLEPRTPYYQVAAVGSEAKPTLCSVRFSSFLDYGQAYLSSASPGTTAQYNLCGTGLGAALNIGQHLGAQLSLALPLITSSATHAGSFHLNFSLSAQF